MKEESPSSRESIFKVNNAIPMTRYATYAALKSISILFVIDNP